VALDTPYALCPCSCCKQQEAGNPAPSSSPDEWPEFDATFFTYSSIILLALTAVVNWTFSALGPKGTF